MAARETTVPTSAVHLLYRRNEGHQTASGRNSSMARHVVLMSVNMERNVEVMSLDRLSSSPVSKRA